MFRTAYLAFLALLATGAAEAQSFSLNYVSWDYAVTGYADDGSRRLDFEQDLQVRPLERGHLELSAETPPGWPDVGVNYTQIEAAGQRTAERAGGVIGLLPIGSNPTASVRADLDDLGLSLRYPLSLQPTRLLLGLTLTQLRGPVSVQQEGDAEETREEISELFPMAHVRLESDLASWLRLGASADYIRYEDDRALRYQAELRLSWGALTLNLGWLKKAYRVNGESYLLDTELSGPYAGAGFFIP